jgi:hypothetical protein
MPDIHISIATDFSRYPAGRTRKDGKFSAESFREEVLIPALRQAQEKGGRVVVLLDGVYGYSSSFLEETFGGIVRRDVFRPAWLRDALVVDARDPIYESSRLDAIKYFDEELDGAYA